MSSEHPWVLVEGDGAEARAAEQSLRALGYEVYVCPGPGRTRTCELLEGEDCSLVAVAEVVVNALGDQDPSGAIASRARATTNAALLRVDNRDDDDLCPIPSQAPTETVAVSADQLARGLRVAFDLVGYAASKESRGAEAATE